MGSQTRSTHGARARPRWQGVVGRTLRASTTDRVSVGGLILHPALAERQLTALSGLLPAPAFSLIENRVYHLVHQSRGILSLHLLAGLLPTFWSSSTGSKSMLSAVNLACGETERRPFLRFQAIGLAMTLGAILCAILAACVLLVLPAAIHFLGWSRHSRYLIHATGMAMTIGFFFVIAGLLYRYGPSRPKPPDLWISPGARLATLLWLSASELLSLLCRGSASSARPMARWWRR